MRQDNMLKILEDLLKSAYFHCEWAIEYEEKQQYIEITLQFILENPYRIPLRDDTDTQLWEYETPYELSILFYNRSLLEIEGRHNLVAIPVDDQVGIPYGELVCIIKYLKNISSTVYIKWHEFIRYSEYQTFSITWHEEEYQELRQRLIDSHRYSHTAIYFPKQTLD